MTEGRSASDSGRGHADRPSHTTYSNTEGGTRSDIEVLFISNKKFLM